MTNFTHAAFYQLNDGAGTSTAESLGLGAPAGSIAGTTTGIWANADCLTINNASGAAGDNAILLRSSYIDEMCRLDNLSGSIVVMLWINQPAEPTNGAIFGYGRVGNNTDGGYAVKCDDLGLIYSIRGGATFEYRTVANAEALGSGQRNTWFAFGAQIDVIDGRVITAAYQNGYPGKGSRVFNLESALPRVDSAAVGARLLATPNGASTSSQPMWGQTQVKRAFVGRTNGDQRHNIPKWMKAFYDTTTGIVPFM